MSNVYTNHSLLPKIAHLILKYNLGLHSISAPLQQVEPLD